MLSSKIIITIVTGLAAIAAVFTSIFNFLPEYLKGSNLVRYVVIGTFIFVSSLSAYALYEFPPDLKSLPQISLNITTINGKPIDRDMEGNVVEVEIETDKTPAELRFQGSLSLMGEKEQIDYYLKHYDIIYVTCLIYEDKDKMSGWVHRDGNCLEHINQYEFQSGMRPKRSLSGQVIKRFKRTLDLKMLIGKGLSSGFKRKRFYVRVYVTDQAITKNHAMNDYVLKEKMIKSFEQVTIPVKLIENQHRGPAAFDKETDRTASGPQDRNESIVYQKKQQVVAQQQMLEVLHPEEQNSNRKGRETLIDKKLERIKNIVNQETKQTVAFQATQQISMPQEDTTKIKNNRICQASFLKGKTLFSKDELRDARALFLSAEKACSSESYLKEINRFIHKINYKLAASGD
ncbi:hypothetical protein ACQZV8_17195 [Magnetococcales bacterium HHB-1]